ncbi:CUB and sushi domain-containing protein 2-like [Haliotis asinina]|uniref:CUB and sushi domain-containing protein 2-like n=1 Tax=Haliotis asinina TaxID=109174 RepID=UPI0035327DAF
MPLTTGCLAFLLSFCISAVSSVHWSHCDAVAFASSKFNKLSTHHGPLFLSIVANSGTCEWRIYARPGYNVLMEVMESSLPPRCDSVHNISVTEGTYVWRNLLGSWCGQQTPTFRSSSSTLSIKFNSIIISNDYGFSVRYKQIPHNTGKTRSLLPTARARQNAWRSPPAIDPPPMQTVGTTPANKVRTWTCSLVPIPIVVTEQEQVLPCPTGQLNIQCCWRLTTQALNNSDFNVHVNIVSDHDDDRPHQCKDAYVQAFDGSPSTSRLLGRWCGQAIATAVSSGQELYLEYYSGKFGNDRDFKVIYVATKKTQLPLLASGESSARSLSTVVGTVFGVVVLLIVITAVVIFCTMYKRKKMATYEPHVETDPVYAAIVKSTRKSSDLFINLPTVSETVYRPTLSALECCTAGNMLSATAVKKGGVSKSADFSDPAGDGCGKVISDEERWTSERTESMSNVYGDLPTIHSSNTT